MSDLGLVRPFDCAQADDQAIAQQVGLLLGMEIPEPCVAGVAMNSRLLADHLAILRRSPEPGQ